MSSNVTAGANSVLDERYFDCVHCGLCLEACPTYVALGTEADSPRGRLHLMRAVDEGRLALDAGVVRHLDLCLGCRACETACPSGVQYGQLIERARSQLARQRHDTLGGRLTRELLIRRTLAHPARLRLLLAPLRLAERIGVRDLIERVLPSRLAGLVRLVPRRRTAPRVARVTPARGPERGAVGVLGGCVAPVFYPDVHAATVRVLSKLGYRVVVPESGCCGALELHAGYESAARARVEHTIRAFERAGVDRVVVNAAGCGAFLRQCAEHVDGRGEGVGDGQSGERRHLDALAFADKVCDVSELILDALRGAAGAAVLRSVKRRVTYHDACHLAHAQGVREAPRQLLAMIPDLECVALPHADTCCGSAGTYNLTEPKLAAQLADDKAEAIVATGADAVVMGNPGCMAQIAAVLVSRNEPVSVLHTVQLIDESLT